MTKLSTFISPDNAGINEVTHDYSLSGKGTSSSPLSVVFIPTKLTTTQRDALSSPIAGLMIYNTTTNKMNFYNGSTWEVITSS